MARDFLGGHSAKNFARGDYPPYDSYEWAGVQLPPNTPAHLRPKPVERKSGGLWTWAIGIGLAFGGVKLLGKGLKSVVGFGSGSSGSGNKNLLLPPSR